MYQRDEKAHQYKKGLLVCLTVYWSKTQTELPSTSILCEVTVNTVKTSDFSLHWMMKIVRLFNVCEV